MRLPSRRTQRGASGGALAGALLAVLACASQPSGATTAEPIPGTPVAPPGVAIAVRGRGPDVVLIHGALGDLRQWRPLGDSLATRNRVIAVSRRFHWPNLDPPARAGEYTFSAQSEDLVALLRSLGRPAHLIGHSHGAGVILLVALAHPELVRSLVLIEPPFAAVVRDSSPEFIGELASRDSMVRVLRADVQAGNDEAAAETLMDWVQGGVGGFGKLSADVQTIVRANARTVGPTYSVPFPGFSCDQLRAVRVPVLVVRGGATRPWFRLTADGTVQCLPKGEAAVIPGAVHMALLENPAGAADRIRRFLAAH